MFVNAYGAQGYNGGYERGYGGWVQALLSVTAGQTLYIYVGSLGFNRGSASFNGGGSAGRYGGSGGGATDIRTISGNLTSRLIVVGGGGGFYASCNYCPGGNGGTKMSARPRIYISTNLCLS